MKPVELQRLAYLYIVEIIGTNQKAIKIGVTAFPSARLGALQIACPFRIRLAATYRCETKLAFRLERGFHRILAPYHMCGEWFSLSAVEALGIMSRRKFPRLVLPKIRRVKTIFIREQKRQKLRNDSKNISGKYVNWLDRYLAARQ